MATIYSAEFGVKPLFMQALAGDPVINYSAAEFRNLIEAIFYTPGVITPTSFLVEQADSVGWAVKVRAGYAATQGYLVTNGADVTVNVSGLNTNPAGTRTHRVYLLVHDKVLTGGSLYAARIAVAEDTGSGATLPDSTASILLGTFTISPGQSNIQNSHITAQPRHASQAGSFVELTPYFNAGFSSMHLTVDTKAPARFRFGSGRVQFSGGIKQNSGSPFLSTSYNLGQLPLIARPKYDQHLVAPNTGTYPWRLYVAKDGTFTATIPGTESNNPQYLYLDGIVYEID